MVDVSHDRHHGRTRLQGSFSLIALQILLDLVFPEHLGRMTELLDYQHRGVLVDRLVDRGHHAHVHEHFDDLGRLDRHFLGELADSHRLANIDLAHHRCGGHLKPMLAALGRGVHRTAFDSFLLLIARADIAGDVQLLTTITGAGILGALRRTRARGTWWLLCRRGSRSLRLLGWLARRVCRGLLRTLTRLHRRNDLRLLECWVESRLGRLLALRSFGTLGSFYALRRLRTFRRLSSSSCC